MANEPIRLGRIKTIVQKALNWKGDIDPNVYYLPEDLDALAAKYPDTYLRKVEEIHNILKDPDFASGDENKVILFRTYYHERKFVTVGIALERHEKWLCKGFTNLKAQEADAFRLR